MGDEHRGQRASIFDRFIPAEPHEQLEIESKRLTPLLNTSIVPHRELGDLNANEYARANQSRNDGLKEANALRTALSIAHAQTKR